MLLLAAVVFLCGLHAVPQQERWVIERFGAYCGTYGPGLVWFFPYMEKTKRKVPVWTLQLPLFTRGNVTVDFKGGGSAKLVNTYAFVQSEQEEWEKKEEEKKEEEKGPAYRFAYSGKNPEDMVIELMENACRSLFNRFMVDEILTKGKGGFDVTVNLRKRDPEGLNGIKEQLRLWGLKIVRLTVGDFDLDKETVAARQEVLRAKKDRETAEYEKRRRSMETVGVKLQMLADALGISPSEAQKMLNKPEHQALRDRFLAESQTILEDRIAGAAGTLVRTRGDATASLLVLLGKVLKGDFGGSGGGEGGEEPPQVKRLEAMRKNFPPKPQ